MTKPLVSVICLCYNHGKYVEQAIESVLDQTYDPVQMIVIDDASTDNSRAIIEKLSKTHGFQAYFNQTNLGNCTSFNRGFHMSKGKYLIDLAADDLLLPDRVRIGVEELEQKDATWGVHFCDVEMLDEMGKSLGTHFKRDEVGNLVEQVPSGDMYLHLVERYLISAPSMMMSRKVLEDLNGYDEDLSYEDFDFWIRSSRNYKYCFTDQVLVKKLVLKKSLSSIQHQRKNRHALSTAKVCGKIYELNKTKAENNALLKRISYELKWALITENWEASALFIGLKKKIKKNSARMILEKIVSQMRPPWYPLWKMIM